MKIFQIILAMAVALSLSSCSALAVSETPAPAEKLTNNSSQPILKIPYADMLVVSAHFSDSTPMETAEPGYKILLVTLERVDGKPLDLQEYTDKQVEIDLLDGDGNMVTVATMGGLLEDGFAIGFRVPDNVKTYKLQSGNGPAIEIIPSN